MVIPHRALLLSIAAAVPLVGADTSATDYWVRVMPGVWLTKLDGDFSYAGPGVSGATTTSPDELGLTKQRVVPQVEAGVQIPFLFSFDAGADLFSEDGTTTLDRTINFGAHSYTGGTAVSTTVTLHDYWGEIGVRPLNLDRIGVGIGIAAHVVHGGVDVDDPALGVSDRLHKTLVIPALALRAHVRPIGSLTLEARVHAVDAGLDHQHFEYIDIAAPTTGLSPSWVCSPATTTRSTTCTSTTPRAAAPLRTSSSTSPGHSRASSSSSERSADQAQDPPGPGARHGRWTRQRGHEPTAPYLAALLRTPTVDPDRILPCVISAPS